ncbi:hypothetical protein B0T14DRAFT_592027 [Immersiella caudata]|uniref:NACHT domain-containing protein n=1 Tax=Immersiella caudata TaxID=314043 RepID=A0AA39WEN9_9PEZI|nr:hypothetical protein B0T14DRAFT_592027 [Immersiella caudata]
MPLRAPPPGQLAARRAIEIAFKDLERTIAPAESRDFASTTLDDVRKAAVDIERQLAARQSLRNTRRLEPLFKGLEHYAKVIEVLANGTDYLPWIWAPIKLVLKIAADYIEAFERIIRAYSQIADSLRRFQLLERSFQGKPEIYPTFAIFYANILTFHKTAYKFVSRPCWKLLFLTTWGRFQREFDGILDDLKMNGDLIDKEANAHNIVEARAMRRNLDSWKAHSLAQLAQSQREQAARQIQGLISWLHLDDSDQLALVDSLTEVGVSHPGTVDWVLKKSQLAAWLRPTADSRFLWLHGGPGTGKSVILAQLVSFLRSSNKSLVVHHFCSFTHGSSTQYDQIIKALLLQLAHGDGDLVNYIYEEYVGSKSATISLLEKLLEVAIEALSCNSGTQGFGAIHILVDGLEECPGDKQTRLIRMLERLMATGSACKVLVSSRDSPNSHVKKKRPSVISMADEKPSIAEAIKRFAAIELENMREKLAQLRIPDDQQWEIAASISIRSDGIYEKLVSRIVAGLDSFSVFRLRLVFGWIAFAKRPLRKAELQSALLFHQENAIKPTSTPVPAYVLDLCKPLVDEHRDSTLGFIHVSVKEYLEGHVFDTSIRLNVRQCLFENAMASLRCLRESLQQFSDNSPNTARDVQIAYGVWGFLPYATEYWCVMLREIALLPEDEWDSRFSSVAMAVSTALHALRGAEEQMPETDNKDLEAMRQFHSLWYDATIGLQARAAGRTCYQPTSQPGHIHEIFPRYESSVQKLVATYEHGELSRKELDEFRESFGHHAFMCRFSSCSHGWSGLTNYQERCNHEATHSVLFSCPEPRCQYPPFGSRTALKRHQLQVHDQPRPKPQLQKSVPPTQPQPSRHRGAPPRHPLASPLRAGPLDSKAPQQPYHSPRQTIQEDQLEIEALGNDFLTRNGPVSAVEQQQLQRQRLLALKQQQEARQAMIAQRLAQEATPASKKSQLTPQQAQMIAQQQEQQQQQQQQPQQMLTMQQLLQQQYQRQLARQQKSAQQPQTVENQLNEAQLAAIRAHQASQELEGQHGQFDQSRPMEGTPAEWWTPTSRTKDDLQQIDHIMEQMQATVYDNTDSPSSQYAPVHARNQPPTYATQPTGDHFSAAQSAWPLTAPTIHPMYEYQSIPMKRSKAPMFPQRDSFFQAEEIIASEPKANQEQEWDWLKNSL